MMQATTSQKLPLLFKKSNSQVRRAELKLSAYIATNDLPILLTNTLTPLCSNIFPDSEIAKQIAMKRTKTTELIKDVLHKNFSQEVEGQLRGHGNYFSLIMDETTDRTTKTMCIYSYIFDKEKKLFELSFFAW